MRYHACYCVFFLYGCDLLFYELVCDTEFLVSFEFADCFQVLLVTESQYSYLLAQILGFYVKEIVFSCC